jgi:hypothetical protein
MAIIDAYSPAGSSSNKAVRSSWASFLVNVSVTLCAASKKASTTSEEQAVVLSAVAELLGTCPEDDYETLARYLVDPHTAIMHVLHACSASSRTARVSVKSSPYCCPKVCSSTTFSTELERSAQLHCH